MADEPRMFTAEQVSQIIRRRLKSRLPDAVEDALHISMLARLDAIEEKLDALAQEMDD